MGYGVANGKWNEGGESKEKNGMHCGNLWLW